MLPLAALLLLSSGVSFLAVGQETTPTTDGDSVVDAAGSVLNSPRIVGGQDVTDRTQYAYQVSLRYYGSHFCGGSIVSTKHVLTAAHCCYINNVLISASTLSAVVGDLYITASADTVTKTISTVTPHENYDANSITNDVALMTLTTAFDGWTSTISRITLTTTAPASGTNCIVSGWGYTEESGRISEVLQTVTVPIVDTSTCVVSYGDSIKSGMICAGYTGGGRDACQGDSGGPLVCDASLAGVVSWGYGCARESYPGVYADVAYFYSWIEEKIGSDLSDNSTSDVGNNQLNDSSNGNMWMPVKIFTLLLSLLLSVIQSFL